MYPGSMNGRSKKQDKEKIVVIGAGAAGMQYAQIAAQRDMGVFLKRMIMLEDRFFWRLRHRLSRHFAQRNPLLGNDVPKVRC